MKRPSTQMGLGGLLIALGAFPLAFVGNNGTAGAILFVVEVALILAGAAIVWRARRR